MSLYEIFLTAMAVLGSLGGGGVIVWSLSSYLGKIWLNQMIVKQKAELQRELELLKNEHRTELEIYKTELEKARSDYNRYSGKKFEIIEETWSAMFNIIQELQIYNLNDGDYLKFLQKTLNVVSNYLVLIRKNSLYFDDDLKKLFSDYVSLCSKVVSNASEEIKRAGNFDDKKKVSEIMSGVYKTATERDVLLEKIRLKLRRELGV